jgi:hypothetical protein
MSGLKPLQFPQADALMITALCRHPEIKGNDFFLNELLFLLDKLKSGNSAPDPYFAWGQPYNWFSRKKIPANTPRTTVTTQAGHAFLDAYEILEKQEYIDIARKAGEYLLDRMQYDTDMDGDICFPYTSLDQYHVHNANVLASALLARLGNMLGEEMFIDFAERSFRFTCKYQNDDGSWFYWAPPDKISGKIDHYHTGFVLESLKIGSNNWNGEFPFENHLEKGTDFYLEQLFEKQSIPKMLPTSTFPVDIQSCAQALITLGEVLPESEVKDTWLIRVADWTISNMYDEKNSYFYYRIYKNRIDKTPYLRWGQSWMLRALSYLYKTNEIV